MLHSLKGQCMHTDQYGMHLHGPQRMENTKLIINTNPSLVDIETSNYKVAPLNPLPHASHRLPHLPALAALALSSLLQCNGSKTITWSITIAMILGETIHLLRNAKVRFGLVEFGVFQICLLHFQNRLFRE